VGAPIEEIAVTEPENASLHELTANLVSSYVSNNNVTPDALPALIVSVHASLKGLGKPSEAPPSGPAMPTAAQIRKSISREALISFEDGKSYKILKRHLSRRGLTPDEYRMKWGLPGDYPMVAPAYSAVRSELAAITGLGAKRRAKVASAGGRGRGKGADANGSGSGR
jgi:predicted transcriptional regulator